MQDKIEISKLGLLPFSVGSGDVAEVAIVYQQGDQYIITIQALEPIQNKQWAQALIVDVGLRKVRFNNGSYSVFQYASGYRTELKKTW